MASLITSAIERVEPRLLSEWLVKSASLVFAFKMRTAI